MKGALTGFLPLARQSATRRKVIELCSPNSKIVARASRS